MSLEKGRRGRWGPIQGTKLWCRMMKSIRQRPTLTSKTGRDSLTLPKPAPLRYPSRIPTVNSSCQENRLKYPNRIGSWGSGIFQNCEATQSAPLTAMTSHDRPALICLIVSGTKIKNAQYIEKISRYFGRYRNAAPKTQISPADCVPGMHRWRHAAKCGPPTTADASTMVNSARYTA